MWRIYLVIVAVATVESINRPAYKIVLTQKGFTQFLQYDVDTPPMREFTMCVWIRLFKLSGDQTIFTYMAHGNKRVVRIGLDTEHSFIKISIDGRASSSTAIDIKQDTWHHICLSYQSDFGAWALYMDGRLASCGASQNLNGYVIPGGGSFIFGYGMAENGNTVGLEGEIFGVGILLISTIERNHTIKGNPQHQQKSFIKNRLNGSGKNNIQYTILGHQATSEATDIIDSRKKSNRNFIRFESPHSKFEYDIGVDLNKKNTTKSTNNNDLYDFSDFYIYDRNVRNENVINFSDIVNEGGNIKQLKYFEQIGSFTKELPILSEFETPPPVDEEQFSLKPKFKFEEDPGLFLLEKEGIDMQIFDKKVFNKLHDHKIPDKMLPPPVKERENVYGQWTTSSFANDVLNYLNTVNAKNAKQRQVPTTIPLQKYTDNFPYSSEFKATKIYAPYKFKRRIFHNEYTRSKRESKSPQINVEILESDLRTQILEQHAKTFPQNVEVKSRGIHEMDKDHQYYRNNEIERLEEIYKSNDKISNPVPSKSTDQLKNWQQHFYNRLVNILPFLKSNIYFTGDESNQEETQSNNKYTKSPPNGNKWHNVKSYSNDFAPREISVESGEINEDINSKIAEANKKQPYIRLKYKPEQNSVKSYTDNAMDEVRSLTTELANVYKPYAAKFSELIHNNDFPINPKSGSMKAAQSRQRKTKNKFNQHVKIGNALNERDIIGENREENKRSFVGGNENTPDINRYRSDIDSTAEKVPPSLGPRICKNVELLDRLFYVQPDESIDVTQILSPVKEKNIGIQYIMQNYRKCSLLESIFETHPLLLINWSKTPVRLFGGAYSMKTKDLCGFF